MTGVLVDSNIILDILLDDPNWADWSETVLADASNVQRFTSIRRGKGTKQSPLPDFYIGAQAAVLGMDLITRDEGIYRTYFSTVKIMCPEK